jgi:hypothetical protein
MSPKPPDDIDRDILAVRRLLAAVRRHDSGDRSDDDPAQCCMVNFKPDWLEAGRAVVRLEKRLADRADLLAALIEIRDLLGYEWLRPEFNAARAAIAKAEGQGTG